MRDLFPNRGVRIVTALLLAFLLGCAQAVIVPDEELTKDGDYSGLYRIHTIDDQYLVQRFAVRDSTIEILELARSDGRYGAVGMPVTVSLKDVTSVAKLPTNKDYARIVVPCFVLLAVVVYLAHEVASAFPATD